MYCHLHCRKYIQVCIHGNTEVEFEMSDWKLTATNTKDVEFLRLNKPGQALVGLLVPSGEWVHFSGK